MVRSFQGYITCPVRGLIFAILYSDKLFLNRVSRDVLTDLLLGFWAEGIDVFWRRESSIPS